LPYHFSLDGAPRQPRSAGLALSFLLHLAAILLLLIPLRRDFERVLSPGPLRPGAGGGGGGGHMAYITLPAPVATARAAVTVTPPRETQATVPVTPPISTPPVIPPPLPVEQPAPPVASAPTSAAADSTGAGPGQGGGTGGGTGGGVGPGNGPGIGPGTGGGGRGREPQSVHFLIPPDDPPKELRGVQLHVTFWVDETGKVVRVAVDPPINDRKFAERFTETMMNFRFHPALGPDGRPVAATTSQTVTY